jgi:hypothetical protein
MLPEAPFQALTPGGPRSQEGGPFPRLENDMDELQRRAVVFVVVWEPKHGGGGHQVALTLDRAETIHRALCRALPDDVVRVEPADAYAAAAVMGRVMPDAAGRTLPANDCSDNIVEQRQRRRRRRMSRRA